MLTRIAGIALGGWGEAAMIGAVVVGLFAWWQLDRMAIRHTARAEGRVEVQQQIRGKNEQVQQAADRAGRKSLDGGGGVRNPHYRD